MFLLYLAERVLTRLISWHIDGTLFNNLKNEVISLVTFSSFDEVQVGVSMGALCN